MKEEIKFFMMMLFLAVIFLLFVFMTVRETYRNGYEHAVEDFYNGKLKCERIEETKTNIKYIWKK